MTEERRRHEDRLLGETIVRLEAHETADSLMFKQINAHMAAIETSIGKLFNRFWVAAIGVILTLMAVSSYLYRFALPGAQRRQDLYPEGSLRRSAELLQPLPEGHAAGHGRAGIRGHIGAQ